ncbi:MAG: chaperonin GroEL [Planctomycetota bacterium]
MAKNITFEDGARESLLAGVTKFARAVKTTLGPRGRVAIIDRGWGAPKITKDGATVGDDVELENPVENVAARMMREAADKTAKEAGDGSTTATVLAEAIFRAGLRNVVAGANPILIQRGITAGAERVIEALRAEAVEVEGEDIAHVATIASNNDAAIGKLIAKAIAKVGNDGVISIQEGKSLDTSMDVVEGLHFDRGYLSQYFVTDEKASTVILEDPYILIFEDKITNLSQILPVMEAVLKKKKPLLIIAEDIEGEALSTLVVNNMRGVLRCAAAKAPGYGDRRKAMLSDIAVATGGTAIFKDLGLEPDSITLGHLGRAKRVEMTTGQTSIARGAGKKADVAERVRQIRMELEEARSDYDREKLQERLARLIGGIAEISVGGSSEAEVKEKKKRFENALSATRSAIEEGILPGGGAALVRAADAVANARIRDEQEKVGVEILAKALEAPFRQLAENAGVEPGRILRSIRRSEESTWGYDFSKREECDLFERGIIDSCRVVHLALQNAVSVATMILTSEAVITEVPSETEDHHHHDEEGVGAF